MAHLGSWQLDLETNHLSWSDEVYRIFGLQPQEFAATYEAFLEHVPPTTERPSTLPTLTHWQKTATAMRSSSASSRSGASTSATMAGGSCVPSAWYTTSQRESRPRPTSPY